MLQQGGAAAASAQAFAAIVSGCLQVPADVQADAETQAKAAQEDSDMED